MYSAYVYLHIYITVSAALPGIEFSDISTPALHPMSSHTHYAIIAVDECSELLGSFGHPYCPVVPVHLQITRPKEEYKAVVAVFKDAFGLALRETEVGCHSDYLTSAGEFLVQRFYPVVRMKLGGKLNFTGDAKGDVELVAKMLAAAQVRYMEDVAATVKVGFAAYLTSQLSTRERRGNVRYLLHPGTYRYLTVGDLSHNLVTNEPHEYVPFANPAMINALKSCYAFQEEKSRISSMNANLIAITATGLYQGLCNWMSGEYLNVTRNTNIIRHACEIYILLREECKLYRPLTCFPARNTGHLGYWWSIFGVRDEEYGRSHEEAATELIRDLVSKSTSFPSVEGSMAMIEELDKVNDKPNYPPLKSSHIEEMYSRHHRQVGAAAKRHDPVAKEPIPITIPWYEEDDSSEEEVAVRRRRLK